MSRCAHLSRCTLLLLFPLAWPGVSAGQDDLRDPPRRDREASNPTDLATPGSPHPSEWRTELGALYRIWEYDDIEFDGFDLDHAKRHSFGLHLRTGTRPIGLHLSLLTERLDFDSDELFEGADPFDDEVDFSSDFFDVYAVEIGLDGRPTIGHSFLFIDYAATYGFHFGDGDGEFIRDDPNDVDDFFQDLGSPDIEYHELVARLGLGMGSPSGFQVAAGGLISWIDGNVDGSVVQLTNGMVDEISDADFEGTNAAAYANVGFMGNDDFPIIVKLEGVIGEINGGMLMIGFAF